MTPGASPQHQQQAAREQERPERQLTVAAMVSAWHAGAMAETTPQRPKASDENRASEGVAPHTAV